MRQKVGISSAIIEIHHFLRVISENAFITISGLIIASARRDSKHVDDREEGKPRLLSSHARWTSEKKRIKLAESHYLSTSSSSSSSSLLSNRMILSETIF